MTASTGSSSSGRISAEVQLSVMKLDVKAARPPGRLDRGRRRRRRATSARCAAGAEIVYPLTDEEWGLRRFFVRDPNGAVINVTEHRD